MMGKYINNNLTNGESVVSNAKIHWFLFVPGTFLLLIASVILAYNYLQTDASTLQLIIGYAILIYALKKITSDIIYRFTTEFAITSKRVIAKTGLIRRVGIDLSHDKIESLTVNQSIPGRMFRYGTITLSGTGGAISPFRCISKPLEFRKTVLNLTDNTE